MTGVRQSIVFQIEDAFGEGNPEFLDDAGLPMRYWVHAPPGSWFSSTHRRDVKRIQSMGSKFWDTVAYGPMSGTWEWTFYLDYNYPEPLFLIFEGGGDRNVKSRSTLRFSKANNVRVPSFTVRVKILDTPVDGSVNEVHVLKGCVVTDATFTKQSNSSYIQVRMSGFYSKEYIHIYDEELMDKTDYVDYDGSLVEYACLTSEQLSGKEFDNAALIQNTDSVTISVSNSAEAIYNTCAPFALNYAEGLSKISFSASSYANHPSYFQLGVLSGGKDFNIVDALAEGTSVYPGSKGMGPTKTACLTSYDAMARDTAGIIGRAYAQSSKSSEFKLNEIVMSAIAHQKGDSGKLMDSVNNCPVKTLELTLVSLMRPYTLDVGAEAWKDMFYYVPPEGSTFKNNVFVETTHAYTDMDGVIYVLDDVEKTAYVFSVPADFSGVEGHFDIPAVLQDYDGKKYVVNRIADNACMNSTDRPVLLTSVNIPPTVNNIGINAFRGVYTLESVTGGLPTEEYPDGGVRRINAGAFFMSRASSSLTVCEMVSDESSTLEEVFPYAFGYARLRKIYIKPDCKYYSSSASGAYALGPFSNMGNHATTAMNLYPEEIKMPLSMDFIGHNEDGSLYQSIFYKTYSKRFVFYQDNMYESQTYVYDDYPIPVGEVSVDQVDREITIGAGYPMLATPWYMSLNHFGDPQCVKIVFDPSVKDIPDGMFLLPDDQLKSYIIDPSAFPSLSTIGRYAFYNSYNGTHEDGTTEYVLRLKCSIGEYAFYHPADIREIYISNVSRVLGPNAFVWGDYGGASIELIDLGKCTRCTTVRAAFQNLRGVQEVVAPPFVSDWYTSAILGSTTNGQDWYRLGIYDSAGNLTKLQVTSPTGKIRPADIQYVKGQKVTSGTRTYTVPRRFFMEDPDPADVAIGVHKALNTVEWINAKWGDVSSTTWGTWSDYMWGEVGQYSPFTYTRPVSLTMGSPRTTEVPAGLDDEGEMPL